MLEPGLRRTSTDRQRGPYAERRAIAIIVGGRLIEHRRAARDGIRGDVAERHPTVAEPADVDAGSVG